jgi:hypothetical protein
MTRQDTVARDAGPRAILNAFNRLADGHGAEIDKTKRDLEIAQAQLEGYKNRQGQAFAHGAYLTRLTELRDQLRIGLTGTGEGVAELAEEIKQLRAGQLVEASPVRTARKVVGEEPVGSRILRKEPTVEKEQ